MQFDLGRIDKFGKQLVSHDLLPTWKSANVLGKAPEKIQLLSRWANQDNRDQLTTVAEGQVDSVLAKSYSRFATTLQTRLHDEGIAGAMAYVKSEAQYWNELRQTLPAKIQIERSERQQAQDELRRRLDRIAGSIWGTRGHRLEHQLDSLVALRSRMSLAELQEVRVKTVLDHLVEAELKAITQARLQLEMSERKLVQAEQKMVAEADHLSKEVHTLNAFEEKLGSREDITPYFEDVLVDVHENLPRWNGFQKDGIPRIINETLAQLDGVDQAVQHHCLLDKHPETVIEKIGKGERLAAPYINLAYDLPNAPRLSFLLTGYRGDQDLSKAIPQGVQVTPSRSLGANEFILADVRLGIELDALAGLDDWRDAADTLKEELPLYTMDESQLDPL